MSINLTQLAADNFSRANVNPLTSPWAIDVAADPGLQIVSDLCEATVLNSACGQIYNYAGGTPNDQYASMTIQSFVLANSPLGLVLVRWTDNGTSIGSVVTALTYELQIRQNAGELGWRIFSGGTGIIASGNTTFTVGDTFTLAVVGTTLFVLQNGTQLTSISNTSHSSGVTALGSVAFTALNDVEFSNFAMGSASLGTVATSTFSTAPGTYSSTQMVTLLNSDSALSGFAQYYTTDGSTPTTSSTLYSGAISVSTTTTIKVLAVATGYTNSAIASGTFTISATTRPTVAGMGTSQFGPRVTNGSIFGTGQTLIR